MSSLTTADRNGAVLIWETETAREYLSLAGHKAAVSEDALRRWQEFETFLERRGKGVAALVSIEDLALLERIEDEQDIKAARKALKEKGGISLDEYKKKHGF